MTFSALSVWIVQAAVTWLAYRDLGPKGHGFLARSLGLQPDHYVWFWLIGLAAASVFMNSRIAANRFAVYTGKRPSQDWHSYGRLGAAQACYWCGLTSFGISLLAAPLVFPGVRLPGVRAGAVCVLALVLNAILVCVVVHALLRRRYRLRYNVGTRPETLWP